MALALIILDTSPGCSSVHATKKPGNSNRGNECDSSLLVTVVSAATDNQAAMAPGLVTLAPFKPWHPHTTAVVSKNQTALEEVGVHTILMTLTMMPVIVKPMATATLAAARHWKTHSPISDKQGNCDISGRGNGR